MAKLPHILHVDMNAFFAACHQAQDPALRNRPLLVSGDPGTRKGIVLTASYEARYMGVKTAMPTVQALRLCPDALLVKPNFKLYVSYSRQIMAILGSFTPLLEPYSIDEAWLDVSGCEKLFGPPDIIAHKIKNQIKDQLGLQCSIGIASTKIMAKLASDFRKPDGLTVITWDDIPNLIWPMPVNKLVGVGPQTAATLHNMGVTTIGDLANFPPALLKQRLGTYGPHLRQLARGQDYSPVDPNPKPVKSVGNTVTLPEDSEDDTEIETILLALAEKVATRLRCQDLTGNIVTVSVKTSNFRFITRSQTHQVATDLTETIYRHAVSIYRQHFRRLRIRSVGITVSGICSNKTPTQLNLFSAEKEKYSRLAQVVDQVRAQFGDQALVRARLLARSPRPKKNC